MDPVLADLLKWCGGGIAWIASVVVTYSVAKRTKVDDLKMTRRHELVERLSILLQEDHEGRESLMRQYQANFSHLSLTDALDAFDRHSYRTINESMDRASDTKAKLHDLSREIAIYVDEATHGELKRYLNATSFTFSSDEMGLVINTHGRCFLLNLNDDALVLVRRSSFENIMKRLRNMRH